MPVKTMVLLLIVLPLLVQAEDNKTVNESNEPDLPLLEFLGSFEQQDNVWLDVEIDELKTAQVEVKQEVKTHE